MAFARPFFLILLVALVYFAYLGRPTGRYGRGRGWAALALRCLIVLFTVLGLAGTQSVRGGDELSTVFLVDVSDSIPNAEQDRALAFVEESLAAIRAKDRAAVVLFGADALVERPMIGGGELGQVSSVPHTHQTDLEGAIQLGMALFPAGSSRRLVLLSDGRPTLGEAEQAVRLAHAQSIQLDVVGLSLPVPQAGQGLDEAWLSELTIPDLVHQGEEFTLNVTARATIDMEAVLTVLGGERILSRQILHLNPGSNTFAVPLSINETGFTSFRAHLAPTVDTYPQNNGLSAYTMVEGPPRVLVVAAGQERETEPYLQNALRAAGLEVEESTPGSFVSDPASLAEYGAVVLVDTPAQALSPRAMMALQFFVRDLGGGLVAVGGPRAYGVGGWYNTPLEETLPVEMTIRDPERFPPMSIVVVIDKSGSMSAEEGGVQKIRLAGEAAARVAELITDLDEITVIAFDDRPVDVIGPLPGSRRDEVIKQVIRLQAGGGGIYVRESLQKALGYLADSDRPVRHVILLADGSDSEHQEGVHEMVEDEIAAQSVTLSTVAIGAGQDLGFLEEIAVLGNGRYHFTDRAANLPVIFAQETQLAMRSYIVEEPFFPIQTSRSPVLTGIEAVPQLSGYVATTPKPASRVILSTHQDDPLLAAWQYGLGRAVAWTSDATSRWAQSWVGWDGFSRFWAQTVRWTITERTDVPVEVTVGLEGDEANISVDVVDDNGAFVNGLDMDVSLVAPNGETMLVELVQSAPGRYEGAFRPQAEGAYVMRVVGSRVSSSPGEEGSDGERAVALTTGWVMGYSAEYAAPEGDPAYLARLAELGGGQVLTEPTEAFARTSRGEGVTRDLWPYLLGLATLLLPFDIGVRRLVLGKRDLQRLWEWLSERWLRYRPRSATEDPSPVRRLFEAKSRAERNRSVDEAPLVGLGTAAGDETSAPSYGAGTGSEAQPVPPFQPAPFPETEEQQDGIQRTASDGTLASRLLRRKQEREGDD